MQKYTIKDLQKDFPNDDACLEWLKKYRWPEGIPCPKCGNVTKHHLMSTRKSYSCQECGHHVHPTAGTIFHKSRTPLTIWFHAIFLMAQTRGGISAKQIERETGVTYKTAWRMCKLIRSRLTEGSNLMSGEVEIDETYIGGRRRGKRGRGAEGKTAVIGMAQRGGQVKATVIGDIKSKTILPMINEAVKPGSMVYTDELRTYNRLDRTRYGHSRIMHSAKLYVAGRVHTNTIEGFWSLVKRGISGVYHSVSPQHLQTYLNEYTFRYNHRKDETPMFLSFLRQVGLPVAD